MSSPLALLVGAGAGAGCGSPSSNSTGSFDSGGSSDGAGGPDGTADTTGSTSLDATQNDSGSGPANDGASDDAQEAGQVPLICTIDADISRLTLPDASIGDSGVSITSCVTCIQDACNSEVTTCEGDCTCKVNVQDFVTCLAGGKSATTCGLALFTSSDPATASLFGCLATSSCIQTCGAG